MLDTKCYKNIKGIYKLNIENHSYIGSSINLHKRLNTHYRELKKNCHENEYLQRCVNKYGIDKLKWEILEIEDPNIEYIDLLKREKYFIEYYHSDLNLKLDPVTQTNCVTIVKKVYQFSQFGDLIKEWQSISDAAHCYNVDSSNIIVACTNRKRQRTAAGFLWDFNEKYSGELKIIYVYNLHGQLIGKYKDTVDIYNVFFKNSSRKTVLSQLKKKIDTKVPYKNIYLSYSNNFKINPNYKPKFQKDTKLNEILKTNPIIYCFDKNGVLLYSKNFNEFHSKSYIRKALRNPIHANIFYSLNNNFVPTKIKKINSKSIIAINIESKSEIIFDSIKDCAKQLFKEFTGANVGKHLKRNTPYKGYIFKINGTASK